MRIKLIFHVFLFVFQLALGALDNRGTEFMVAFMDNKILENKDIQPEIFVTTAKNKLVHVTITGAPNSQLHQTFTVTRGQVHHAAFDTSYRLVQTELARKAILIQADDEIVVYGVNREVYSDDAYLALPTDVLGKEYYTLSYSPSYYYCLFAVIGIQDNTHVSIRLPNTPNLNITLKGHTYKKNQWINVTLDRFSTLEIHAIPDLTGSYVVSDKPVGVLSGNKKAVVGSTGNSRDHLVEMLLPISSWGKNYATVPIPERNVGDIFRFLSSEDNTHVNITGVINGKPFHDTLTIPKAGQYVQKQYDSALYSHIVSDKPISLFQFSKTQGSGDLADPAMIIVPPIEQYAADYTFTTPKYSKGDYTNYFMFIVDSTQKAGLRLDNQPLPQNQHYVSIPGTNLVAGFIKISVGTHSVSHTNPTSVIGAILFGKANLESYGFPVGLLLTPVNTGCQTQKMQYGDEIDNDCDGEIDEEECDRKAACTSCLIKISKQSTEIEAESLDQGKCEDDQIQQCTNLNTDDETYLMETDELDMLTEKENICDNLIEISASEYTVTSEESGSQNYLSQSQQSVRSYERGSYLTSLNDFLSSVRLQEFSEKERKTWQSYTFKTRNTYKERIDEIMKLIIGILFPNDVDEVIEDIKCPKQLNEENRTDHTEYKDIVTSYRKAESWQQGRQVLSVLASRMSFKDLLSLLPEVTSHRYYAALSHSKKIGPALPIPDKKLHRQKLDPERLDSFLDFITSSHVVRDLPFGEKKLKFSDGTVHNLPNVVRCMGSADIIQQYKAYCQENEVLLLGDSTMFKILAQCGAKVRKSLEGLDYFVAEGGRAFITLQDVLDKLLTYDAISPDDHKSFQALFLQSKQYLRTDYKIHISKGREVADHCMLYALSDEKDEAFIEQCSHNHQMVCESCEQLKETIAALEKIFVTSSVDGKEDEMNDLNFRVQQATRNIFSLKKHIIRCKNQDLAKTHLFETMPTDEVLLVCDWAMKFLPRKFREDQCDWFGKRGIPWHISIAFCRKDDGSIGSLGFVHLFATQISQDSRVTASIIQDVMDKIREINTTDIKFHVWSDNAGCYKSTEMLSFLFHSGLILSYDFCESQNGKGPCDRTAATIKSSIRRYVNQGHDVLTAQSMKKAIDKSAKNVKYIVRVIEGTECRKTKYTPIPAIYGITAWKAYQVGTGKLIPSSNIPTVEKCILNTSCSEIEGEIDVVYHQLPLKAEEEENTITCANEGCTLSFSSFHELSSHLMFGKCEFEFRCQFSNGCDITKKTYITKMSKSFSTNFQVSSAGLTVGIDDNSDLELGWALKEERKNKRFNVNQKEYLTEKFNKGLKTGRKEDPFLVSEEMLTERKEDGNRRFSYDEILSVQQITSFFSRMSRKNKSFDDSVDASREETITTIRRELTADELN